MSFCPSDSHIMYDRKMMNANSQDILQLMSNQGIKTVKFLFSKTIFTNLILIDSVRSYESEVSY